MSDALDVIAIKRNRWSKYTPMWNVCYSILSLRILHENQYIYIYIYIYIDSKIIICYK